MAVLPSLFGEKSLKPAWEFQSQGIIWRILVSRRNLIVGETRNQQTKLTTFFCVDAFKGEILWQDIEFEEKWWIGIEAVYENWIILHKFARPDMPEHRGILLLNMETGKIIWENDQLTYWFADNGKLYAYKYMFEKRLGYEIEISTGKILNEYSENLDSLHELRNNILEKESAVEEGLTFPVILEQKSINNDLYGIICNITGKNSDYNKTEYIYLNDILAVSFYRSNNSVEPVLLEDILAIYNTKSKQMVYNEVIEKDARSVSMDTFFVKNGFLYFIKNKHILTAIKPWKS